MTDWLTPPSPPTTPPYQSFPVTPRRKVISIIPSGYMTSAMALNSEPADPAVRESQHMAPKSYADAAEEALQADDSNDNFDEADIKETPPPSAIQRNHSEVRPLGEMIDEDERSLPPNSPTLRHVSGRLEKTRTRSNGHDYDNASNENKLAAPNFSKQNGHTNGDTTNDATESTVNGNGPSYANAVKEVEPTSPHVDEQNGPRPDDVTKEIDTAAVPDAASQNGHSYAEAVKDVEPTAPHADEQNGPRSEDAAEPTTSSDAASQNGHSYAEAVKDVEPTAPHADEQNGPRPEDAATEPTTSSDAASHNHTQNGLGNAGATKETQPTATDAQNGHSYADAVKDADPTTPHLDDHNWPLRNGVIEDAPTSYSGVGSDDAPRSPTPNKAHKRVSSRSLHNSAKKQAQQALHNHSEEVTEYQKQWQHGAESDRATTNAGIGIVFEERYNSKSGLNLTTVESDSNLNEISLTSRADKDITTEPDAVPRHKRQSSELVSGRRAGAGWATSAIRWAPANIPLQRRLQTLMVLVHTLSIAGGLAMFFLLCTIPLLWPILLPYLIYVLLSNAPTSGELSHRSELARNSRIWSLFASYYPARLHRTVPLEPTRKYIFGYHPHGIISHGAFAAFATEALGFKQLFPGITNTLLTLDANFRVPLYRDYALRMGLASVSRESCENILSKGGRNGEGMGRAITIVIGGARESLDAKPGSLKLVLKKRKGFVKLAIRQGADVVPVLAFGENDLYEQFDSTKHPYVHKAQLMVKKMLGFTVPLFHARGEFPEKMKNERKEIE
jgi:2-acylglycerol O-acyltransferase 2